MVSPQDFQVAVYQLILLRLGFRRTDNDCRAAYKINAIMVRRQIVCHMTTEWRSHEVKQAAESHDNYFPIDRAIMIPWSNLFSDQCSLPPPKSISKSNNLQQIATVSSKIPTIKFNLHIALKICANSKSFKAPLGQDMKFLPFVILLLWSIVLHNLAEPVFKRGLGSLSNENELLDHAVYKWSGA